MRTTVMLMDESIPPLKVGVGMVGVEIPTGLVLRAMRGVWDWVRRRPRARRVEVLARHGDIWLQTYCTGRAWIAATIFHPGTTRCPVQRIDVERWTFGTTLLQVQPFGTHVESRGDRQFTEVFLELQLHEGDINTVKTCVPSAALDSEVAKSHGLPYQQRLEIRLHFRGRRSRQSQLCTLEVPNVVLHVAGRLHRTFDEL